MQNTSTTWLVNALLDCAKASDGKNLSSMSDFFRLIQAILTGQIFQASISRHIEGQPWKLLRELSIWQNCIPFVLFENAYHFGDGSIREHGKLIKLSIEDENIAFIDIFFDQKKFSHQIKHGGIRKIAQAFHVSIVAFDDSPLDVSDVFIEKEDNGNLLLSLKTSDSELTCFRIGQASDIHTIINI